MKTTLPIALFGLLSCGPLIAAPPVLPNPDFTKGEPIPEGATKDWTLGAAGARGWMHTHRLATIQARQVYITKVAPGSPADGVLQTGDVLLGVAGKPFSYDPREEIGEALTAAEAGDGKLAVARWRAGETETVSVELPVLGSYSPTAPYDCEKSKRILEQSSEELAKRMAEPDYGQNAITRSLNALGLLATGDPKYFPVIKKEAEWAAEFSTGHMASWWYGYTLVFLSEYVMATGDESILPGLRRIAMETANGQSSVGSWGHKFARPDGRLYGYGMMNSPGVVLTIGLVLAREAGVKDPEVTEAIDRSVRLLRFYIGKGSVPYGDHAPYMAGHEDNGKCGMSAVLFDFLGDEEGAGFFGKMSTAAHGSERDEGHTGNYFNITWAMPGVSRCGPNATGAWMEEFGAWYFDLARDANGAFPHQGAPKSSGDSYKNWDATGMYLIAYAMPRKALRLTGRKPSPVPALDSKEAHRVVLDGRGFSTTNPTGAYNELPPDMLLERLRSWSPIVRERASHAIGRRKDMPVEPVIQLLDAPSVEARLGACQALAKLGGRGEPAVPKLRELLKSDDMWLRVQAAEALSAIGQPAMAAVPDLLKMIAKGPTPEDPRAMEQRFLAQSLFNTRSGLLGRSLEGVDREQLLEAVRSGLHNEDGRTRGAFSSVYSNLSFEELEPLLPAIHRAIVEKSPSGIMFDGQIQAAGLDLFSKHHVSEGIELTADYVRLMKPHGSQKQIEKVLAMLKRYGAHAQRAIPLLEKAIYYFENEEQDFPKKLSLEKAEKVRVAIGEIRAMTEKPELRELNL
ncbi:hypothetical protein HAHE_29790 [Haloferula helveola]|uniref:PDZ domain-containing protein n=1 Tax=Haloferula helveola TaxID=490095 RepID=A0ABN6H613_9BACT|nr:hypothetical protein HAHE_29790 [Haloferula helveola]